MLIYNLSEAFFVDITNFNFFYNKNRMVYFNILWLSLVMKKSKKRRRLYTNKDINKLFIKYIYHIYCSASK